MNYEKGRDSLLISEFRLPKKPPGRQLFYPAGTLVYTKLTSQHPIVPAARQADS